MMMTGNIQYVLLTGRQKRNGYIANPGRNVVGILLGIRRTVLGTNDEVDVRILIGRIDQLA